MNVVVLEGRLGRDIEMRYSAGGSGYGVVSLCNSVYAGRAQSGEAKYSDLWIDCHFEIEAAERNQERLVKGRFISVQGMLRQFQTEEGKQRGLPPRMYLKVQSVSFPPQGRAVDEKASGAPTPAPAAPPPAQRETVAAERPVPRTTQVGADLDDDGDDYAFT